MALLTRGWKNVTIGATSSATYFRMGKGGKYEQCQIHAFSSLPSEHF